MNNERKAHLIAYLKKRLDNDEDISMLDELMEISIKIPLSENDLQELQSGEEFDWTFDGIDVHLYQSDEDEE